MLARHALGDHRNAPLRDLAPDEALRARRLLSRRAERLSPAVGARPRGLSRTNRRLGLERGSARRERRELGSPAAVHSRATRRVPMGRPGGQRAGRHRASRQPSASRQRPRLGDQRSAPELDARPLATGSGITRPFHRTDAIRSPHSRSPGGREVLRPSRPLSDRRRPRSVGGLPPRGGSATGSGGRASAAPRRTDARPGDRVAPPLRRFRPTHPGARGGRRTDHRVIAPRTLGVWRNPTPGSGRRCVVCASKSKPAPCATSTPSSRRRRSPSWKTGQSGRGPPTSGGVRLCSRRPAPRAPRRAACRGSGSSSCSRFLA